MTEAWKQHWPEYLIEAASLGLFMIAAFTFGTLLEHPASPLHQMIADRLSRRFLMGLAMGATAVTIIYSPWGKQSGAHINPSTTITFFRLGKVAPWDVVFYIIFQFIGGLAGALLAVSCSLHMGLPPVGPLCGDNARQRWSRYRVRCRDRHQFHSDDGDLERLEQHPMAQVYRVMRQRFDRDLYHFRSAHLRHEHEPRPHRCLGPAGAALDRVVDLYHCPPYRHVGGRRSLRANQRHAKRLLRQAQSRQRHALYFLRQTGR